MRLSSAARVASWLKGDYVWSVIGSVLPQAAYLLTLPVLSRLYSPADYGHFAVVASLSAIAVALASLRYESAVMLPRQDSEAWQIVKLCLMLSVLVIGGLAVLGGLAALTARVDGDTAALLPWVTGFALTQAAGQLLAQFMVRMKRFLWLAVGRLGQAGIVFAVAWQMHGNSWAGLVQGGVAGAACFTAAAAWACHRQGYRLSFDFSGFAALLRKYSYFPRKSLLAVMLNVSSYQLVFILVPLVYGAAFAGLFAQVSKVFFAPLAVVSGALAQVFYAHAAQLTTGSALRQYLKRFHFVLGGAFLLPVMITAAWGETLIGWFLGDAWRGAGMLCLWLAPFFWFNLVFSASSPVVHLYQKGFFEFFLNLSLLVASLAPLALAFAGLGPESYIAVYAGLGCAVFAYFGVWTYRNADEVEKRAS
jgi:O-antigen/teichoic acid export membrane protein